MVNRPIRDPHNDPDPDATHAQDPPEGEEAEGSELEQLRPDLGEATDRVLRRGRPGKLPQASPTRIGRRKTLRQPAPLARSVAGRRQHPTGIAAAEKSADNSRLLDGIRMVASSLEATLARHHCQRIAALGQPFDPAVHEAIAQQPAADVPPHTVVAVAQDGYLLYDRVVRPAQVVVSILPSSDGKPTQ